MDELSNVESKILQLAYHQDLAAFKIAELLSDVESAGLWRDKRDEDGNPPRHFKHYLKLLSRELRDQGLKVSEGSLERYLSFYRLYIQKLGFDVRSLMLIGTVNLDEIRKIVDWDPFTRTIGPGGDGKLNEEDTRRYINSIIDDLKNGARIFTQALRDEVNSRLGRVPVSLKFVFRKAGERFYLTDMQIWEGPTVYRPREGVDDRWVRWLAARCRAMVQEVG